MKSLPVQLNLKKLPVLLWVLAVCLIIVVMYCYCAEVSGSDNIRETVDDGWVLTGTDISVNLADNLSIPKDDDGSYSVSNVLPEDIDDGEVINFHTKSVFFTVYVNGEQRYDYHPEVPATSGRSTGSSYHTVVISSDDSARTVTIVADPVYDDDSCFFRDFSIESPEEYTAQFMRAHVPAAIVCILIVFSGILFALISLLVPEEAEVSSDAILALAGVAITVGGWALTETMFIQYAFHMEAFAHSLNFFLMILMPFPVVSYVNKISARPVRFCTGISMSMTIIVFIICSFLNYSGIKDFHECLPIIHFNIILAALAIIVMVVRSVFYRKHARNKVHSDIRWVWMALFVFGVFVLTDVIRYTLSSHSYPDNSAFTRVGLLLAMLILLVYYIGLVLGAVKSSSENHMFKRMAYVDVMTGLGNRAAFREEEKTYTEHITSGVNSSVICCQFDLNGLKDVNDTQGHAAGDTFIIRAAAAISDIFGGVGSCFRTGGDEFFVFAPDISEDEFADRLKVLSDKYKDISIAYGFCNYRSMAFASIEVAEILADKRMYEMKRKMKDSGTDTPDVESDK
ncbi:MAG: GGDEF domain-containing protein [Mageeibacillus sp.]|jgi:diguanylate cyclase (GGDEF)-like protein|nr:GGDEF domain-containing protein [Mageeibacillus sp.]